MARSPSDRLSRWLSNGAAVALVAMLGITVADVVLRNLFNQPILGTTEIVQMTLVYVVFLGIPETFLKRSHVTVDIADHLLSRRVIRWFDLIGSVAALALLSVMLWMMADNAWDAYDLGDTTSDLTIPLTVFWAPMLVGGACSVVAIVLLAWRDLRNRAEDEPCHHN